MADNDKNEDSNNRVHCFQGIIRDRPNLINYYNSLNREELLRGLELEIQMFNAILENSKAAENQVKK